MSETNIRPEFMIGEEPPDDLMEYTAWARRVLVGSLETVHDTLTRLVTLSAALLGGAAVALNNFPIAKQTRSLALLLFFASLTFSLWGSLPWKNKVNPAFPLDVKLLQEQMAKKGMFWIRVTVACIFCGFALLVGNLIAVW
jgi:hypothetical protein